MSSLIYNTWKAKDGNDWATGADSAYQWMLVTSSYTPDPDHTFPNASGLASNEITGGSYARQNIASRARAVDNTNDVFNHTANNPTFTALTGPAAPKYLIGYRVVTTDADHQLVVCLDLGTLSIIGDFMPKLNGGTSSGTVFKGG